MHSDSPYKPNDSSKEMLEAVRDMLSFYALISELTQRIIVSNAPNTSGADERLLILRLFLKQARRALRGALHHWELSEQLQPQLTNTPSPTAPRNTDTSSDWLTSARNLLINRVCTACGPDEPGTTSIGPSSPTSESKSSEPMKSTSEETRK